MPTTLDPLGGAVCGEQKGILVVEHERLDKGRRVYGK